jgi:hypothetical protein
MELPILLNQEIPGSKSLEGLQKLSQVKTAIGASILQFHNILKYISESTEKTTFKRRSRVYVGPHIPFLFHQAPFSVESFLDKY